MILTVEKKEFDTNVNIEEMMSIGIDANSPELFDAMTSGLYKYPIKAICREISANAYDANRSVGKEHIPIKVYLPGEFLAIRDEGPGMPPELIRDTYRWLGRSNKRHTNLLRGSYGLGSKTPYTYVSEFIVETIVDGISYTYSIMKDGNGSPGVLPLDQHPTKQCNGTTVKVPVKPQDVRTFRQEMFFYTKFWKTQPEFVGHEQPIVERPTIDTPNWAIYSKPLYDCNVLLDGVPYYDNKYSIPQRVVLKFSISQLDTTVSRDELAHSEKTNEKIKTTLEQYNKEVLDEVHKQIASIDSFADVIRTIESIPNSHTIRTYNWKGKTFQYPLQEPVLYMEKPYSVLQKRQTKVFSDDLTDNSFILNDKTVDFSSYDSQRVRSYLTSNNLKGAYLLPSNNSLPVDAIPLTSIKVPKTSSSISGTKSPKIARTFIRARSVRYKRLENYNIARTSPIIYVTEGIYKFRWAGRFPVQIIEMNTKEAALIAGQPNWYTLEEFLKENLYDKVDDKEVQMLADHELAVKTYKQFEFLKNFHDDFKFLDVSPLEKKYPEMTRQIVSWMVNCGKVKPNENAIGADLFKKYPMLKICSSYLYDSSQKIIKDYITQMNSNSKIKPNTQTLIGATN